MAAERKGAGQIKSVRALLDRRRSRTSGGALTGTVHAGQRARTTAGRAARAWPGGTAISRPASPRSLTHQVRLQQFVQVATGTEPQPLPVADAPRRLVTRQLDY